MSAESILGDLLDVQDARAVVIHDAWTGYSHHSPIAGAWELRRVASGGLAVQGGCPPRAWASRWSTSPSLPRRLSASSMPSSEPERLLALYEPLMDNTDDFPYIEIALHVGGRNMMRPAGIALLFTASQGEFHAPWGAFVGGQVVAIPGEEVGRALAALRAPRSGVRLNG